MGTPPRTARGGIYINDKKSGLRERTATFTLTCSLLVFIQGETGHAMLIWHIYRPFRESGAPKDVLMFVRVRILVYCASLQCSAAAIKLARGGRFTRALKSLSLTAEPPLYCCLSLTRHLWHNGNCRKRYRSNVPLSDEDSLIVLKPEYIQTTCCVLTAAVFGRPIKVQVSQADGLVVRESVIYSKYLCVFSKIFLGSAIC